MADLNRLSASLTGLKEIVEADKDTNSVDDDEHQARLEQELEQIRQVNDVTEGVIESLKVTELNLDVRVIPFIFYFFDLIFILTACSRLECVDGRTKRRQAARQVGTDPITNGAYTAAAIQQGVAWRDA